MKKHRKKTACFWIFSLVLYWTCSVDPLMFSSLWQISINQCTGSDLWPLPIKLSPHESAAALRNAGRRVVADFSALCICVFLHTLTHMSLFFVLLHVIEVDVHCFIYLHQKLKPKSDLVKIVLSSSWWVLLDIKTNTFTTARHLLSMCCCSVSLLFLADNDNIKEWFGSCNCSPVLAVKRSVLNTIQT